MRRGRAPIYVDETGQPVSAREYAAARGITRWAAQQALLAVRGAEPAIDDAADVAAFVRRHPRGGTIENIAAALGCSEHSVRKLLASALAKGRAALTAEGE